MMSPTRPIGARQRAQMRALRETIDPPTKTSPSQTRTTQGVITPPPIPIPPITSVPPGSVELIGLIPTTRLSLSTTKNTGEIDSMSNITAITQEDNNQSSHQVEEEEEERHSLEDVLRIKNRVKEKLIEYYTNHNQTLPPRIKVSGHDLVYLATNGLLETILCLKETHIVVESDPLIGDDIQCCDA